MPTPIVEPTIEARKKKLEEVRLALRQEFFGIDAQIDAVMTALTTWYLMPEVMSRVCTVPIWGLTGTGKSALVRSIVRHLGFTERYLELCMDGMSAAGDHEKSIRSILESSPLEEGKPGIIFLDEFQRYRTIDEMGKDIKVERYQDVWMLLGEGIFPGDYNALLTIRRKLMFWDYLDDRQAADKHAAKMAEEAKIRQAQGGEKEDGDGLVRTEYGGVALFSESRPSPVVPGYQRKYYMDFSDAEELKRILRCPESPEEIMSWPESKAKSFLRAAIDAREVKPLDYTKCLIFVAGNLDEAFHMAGDVEDCDTNADIFHEYSKKVGVIEIKKALAERFRPEQIARLGNNHVIYPALSSDAYRKLIRRSCLEYTVEATKRFGIEFELEDSVYDEIYENAVYPTQGTRPVFTSVHKMFSSPLSDAICWAKEHGFETLQIRVDIPGSAMVFRARAGEHRVKIDLDIRSRRAKYSADYNALVAVHEAGHAILYADLFKRAPVEIAISVASFSGGYNRFSGGNLSKNEILHRIAVGMGGIAAEELIFGSGLRSSGCESDVKSVTLLAGEYIRTLAMGSLNSRVTSPPMGAGHVVNTDLKGTNYDVDDLVAGQRMLANTRLAEYRTLLVDLSRHLLKVKKLDAKAAFEFLKDRVEGVQPHEERDVSGKYAEILGRA